MLLRNEVPSASRVDGVDIQPIDSTFLGVPLLSAVLPASNETRKDKSDVVVLFNADIVLYDNFPVALGKFSTPFERRQCHLCDEKSAFNHSGCTYTRCDADVK